MTVGEVVDLLTGCDRGTPVRLAINPFFPMAHKLGGVVIARDEKGTPAVFIAEAKDAEQLGHLPPDVAVQLTWQAPAEAPSYRRRKAARATADTERSRTTEVS
ncbi:hypothetical protein [Streptomyces sp. NPDC003077]|uniref:hypothetical protein n=1 Tax=Streptomyces sp. NPDC003077 TaxID=3154443 RepID=UPI0033A5D4EF